MKVFTYSRARQELASILDRASREGEVRIRRRDGRLFTVQPVRAGRSPLNVPGIRAAVTTDELVRIIRQGRRGRPNVPPPSNTHRRPTVAAQRRAVRRRGRSRRS